MKTATSNPTVADDVRSQTRIFSHSPIPPFRAKRDSEEFRSPHSPLRLTLFALRSSLFLLLLCAALPLPAQDPSALSETERKEAIARAQILSQRGIALYQQGKYSEAVAIFREVLTLREKSLGPDHPDVATSLNNLATLLDAQGDYAAAKPLFERALKIYEKALGPDHPDVATSLNSLAELLRVQGDYAAAKPLFERALKIREKSFGPDHPDVATSLNNLAVLLHAQGDYVAAKPLFERALKIREKSFGPDHPDVATSLNSLAVLLSAQGDYAAAKPLFERVLKIREKSFGPDHRDVAQSLNNLAELLRVQGDYAAAKPLYERALKIWEKALGPDHPDVALSLNNLAGFLYQQGDKAQAVRHLAESCRILEAQRYKVAGAERERAQFMEVHGSQFPQMVVWQAEAGDSVQSLNFFERGRARSFLETLAESRARVEESLPEPLRQRREALMGRLNALEKQRQEAAGKQRPVEPILAAVKDAEKEWDALAVEIRRANPRYAALEYPQPMDTKQLAAAGLLDEKTALVSFTLTQEQSVALAMDNKGGVQSVMLGKADADLSRLLLETLAAIESAPMTRQVGGQLHELYKKWFAPIEPLLKGKERLIVLADGGLHLLPFEMLLTEEPQSDNPAEWSWLVKKYEIHYGPSGTVLAQLREERRAKGVERRGKGEGRTLLAVADPPFSEQQAAEMKAEGAVKLAQATRGSGHEVFRDVGELFRFDPTRTPLRLPGTRVEAQGVAKLLGEKNTTLLLGSDATEKRVWELSQSGELAKYRYVHFATHGWVDTERPERSGLLLSLADKSEGYDGLLQMREIFALKLDADLVVLSACQTGRGKLMRGEGVVGLAQAFFYAGTPSLVVSLWNVNDASTALLMKRFYANLLTGKMSKSAALREAKLWLMTLTDADLKAEDKALAKTDTTRGLGAPVKSAPGATAHPYAHPRHWAPFVLIGDSE